MTKKKEEPEAKQKKEEEPEAKQKKGSGRAEIEVRKPASVKLGENMKAPRITKLRGPGTGGTEGAKAIRARVARGRLEALKRRQKRNRGL